MILVCKMTKLHTYQVLYTKNIQWLSYSSGVVIWNNFKDHFNILYSFPFWNVYKYWVFNYKTLHWQSYLCTKYIQHISWQIHFYQETKLHLIQMNLRKMQKKTITMRISLPSNKWLDYDNILIIKIYRQK